MKRRALLRRTSALGVLALAGCLSSPDDGGSDVGSDPTETPTGTQTETPVDDDTDTPTESTSNGVTVVDAQVRTVSRDCASGHSSGATVSVEGSGSVQFSGILRTPTPCYDVALESVDYDSESDALTITVGTRRQDGACRQCVGAVEFEGAVELDGGVPTDVSVRHDGRTLPASRATDPLDSSDSTPTLETTDFEVTNASSGSVSRAADVTFDTDARRVVVDGTIVGPNGCSTAKLGDVSYDRGTDTLSVSVVTTTREDAKNMACTQALVGIEYLARFGFEGGVPGTVVVSHDGEKVETERRE